jgi:ABC-2 type transport system permease protein
MTVDGMRGAWNVFTACLWRDYLIARRSWAMTILRMILQPLLFVFSFAYVFPKVGQAIQGPNGSTFSTLLIPGTVGSSAIQQGIAAIGFPLVGELGSTHEMEDRALAPYGRWIICVAKVAFGMVQSLLACILVFFVAYLLPSTPSDISFAAPLKVGIEVLLATLTGATFGLAVGTVVRPQHISLAGTVLLVPITFLGATYYPWTSLRSVPWLQWSIVINPLVWVNEGLRSAMSPSISHVPATVSSLILVLICVAFFWIGRRMLDRRIDGR